MKIDINVICNYCGKKAFLVDGFEIYGFEYKGMKFWRCDPCLAHVGVHKHTNIPLGKLANYETRMWRRKAHSIIDPLWMKGCISRKGMYKNLSKALGWDVHVGDASVEECKSIIYAAKMLWG